MCWTKCSGYCLDVCSAVMAYAVDGSSELEDGVAAKLPLWLGGHDLPRAFSAGLGESWLVVVVVGRRALIPVQARKMDVRFARPCARYFPRRSPSWPALAAASSQDWAVEIGGLTDRQLLPSLARSSKSPARKSLVFFTHLALAPPLSAPSFLVRERVRWAARGPTVARLSSALKYRPAGIAVRRYSTPAPPTQIVTSHANT